MHRLDDRAALVILMLFLALSLVLGFLVFKGLDVFQLSTPVRLILAAVPVVLTFFFGLFGFLGAVTATVSLYIKPS
jgi:hypothetical protein